MSLTKCLSRLTLAPGCRSFSSEALKKTPLYDFHVKNGGKVVPFAGYAMPVQYGSQSITASHEHTRNHVSIFDVSHMLQSKIHGTRRVEFMESLVVADVKGLQENTGSLTVYTTPSGGIIDDLIVSKTPDYLYVVSNAGCVDKDLAHVRKNIAMWKDIDLEVISDHALIAVQGPGMHKVLSKLSSTDMASLKFMNTVECDVAGVKCRVTRCGYTGEDGVEISIPSGKAEEVVKALLNSKEDQVLLAGLGARDTLRLEAGLCLYGNDIDETTSPIEAGLTWCVAKRRRQTADFPGADIILKQIKEKPTRRRVGLMVQGAAPARHHVEIHSNGQKVGLVTSGGPSPSLKKNIAMGYVPLNLSKNGTTVQLKIRNKMVDAVVTKMPFVETKYFN